VRDKIRLQTKVSKVLLNFKSEKGTKETKARVSTLTLSDYREKGLLFEVITISTILTAELEAVQVKDVRDGSIVEEAGVEKMVTLYTKLVVTVKLTGSETTKTDSDLAELLS
jgi:hypothetical protein